jgi:membrane fusion protein (multidrug efflux system)
MMSTSTNAPAAASAPTPIKSSSPKRKKILLIIASIFIVIAVIAALYWLFVARFWEDTDNAYVQGNVVQVTPQVGGTVSQIFVDDTNVVKAGQKLLSLDLADADVAVAQAEAQLAQTVRQVRTLYASQGQSEANVELRKTELQKAQEDLSRRKALAGSGAVSSEEIHHAEIAVASAKAAVAAAEEELASSRAMTQGTTIAQHPNVQRAAAQLQEAMLAQSRSTLYAPVGGEVAKRSVQVGQRISPGTPVMAIVPLEQVWVDANFKEAQLRKMRIGQPVKLTADLYGGKVEYDGKVAGLSAGTGSAFALLPAQNATGNWIKVVQRVPVRITLDPKQVAEHPLRVGLSMTVEVDLHDQSGAPVGAAGNNAALTANMSAADESEAKAKARINAIINANLK